MAIITINIYYYHDIFNIAKILNTSPHRLQKKNTKGGGAIATLPPINPPLWAVGTYLKNGYKIIDISLRYSIAELIDVCGFDIISIHIGNSDHAPSKRATAGR